MDDGQRHDTITKNGINLIINRVIMTTIRRIMMMIMMMTMIGGLCNVQELRLTFPHLMLTGTNMCWEESIFINSNLPAFVVVFADS